VCGGGVGLARAGGRQPGAVERGGRGRHGSGRVAAVVGEESAQEDHCIWEQCFFVRLIIRTYQLIFSIKIVFFSHNKIANGIFSYALVTRRQLLAKFILQPLDLVSRFVHEIHAEEKSLYFLRKSTPAMPCPSHKPALHAALSHCTLCPLSFTDIEGMFSS
jgi:hypothetical protein